MALDPVAVALKFGFLAVLYLFLFWMARSALKDLRRGARELAPAYEDATGMHHATAGLNDAPTGTPKLRVASAAGLRAGSAYDLSDGALLGRGESADIRLEDTFASSAHARLVAAGGRDRPRGPRLDQRHLPQRGAAQRPATAPRW